jgi:hypothetical protein
MNKAKKLWFLNSNSVDADAQAYFTAAGITDATEKTAWNSTVVALKAAGLYIGNILYPFLGNTSSQQKYNAVNPLNTDGANRLAFAGGATYNSTGYNPNGTTGYADPFFEPAVGFSGTAGDFGYVSLTTGQVAGYDMACSDNGTIGLWCIARYSDDNSYFSMGGVTFISVANTNGSGMRSSCRRAGATEGYLNGLRIANQVVAAPAMGAGRKLFIGANSDLLNAPTFFSARNYAFAFIIPLGLTEAQHLTFYNIINTNFLTPLGRV